MNEIIATSSKLILPQPRIEISVRPATMDDLPFMDRLHKMHTKQLGHWPTKQFEGYLKMGAVIIAETNGSPMGYCISRDRYLKRDELGIIYQLCVMPGDQRKLIGASLIKAAFDRSAFGCRLYCCWCAQDIDANYFWESLGFAPVAFRAGSDKKRRVHIFWQKRIRKGDTTTPWWFPAKTEGGLLRADRLVFPIPPGVHWKNVQAVKLEENCKLQIADCTVQETPKRKKQSAIRNPQSAMPSNGPAPLGGFRFAPVKKTKMDPQVKKTKRETVKIDPKYVTAARELRDRWMEAVQSGRLVIESNSKYDMHRTGAIESQTKQPLGLLAA